MNTSCYECGQEAVGRCFNCGALFCGAHGNVNCSRCDAAIRAGDPSPDRFSAAPLAGSPSPRWWRPQPAEEYAPPECRWCRAIARRVCRHCQARFCPDHAGGKQLCLECAKSARVGVYILLGVALLFGVILLWNVIARWTS